MSEESEKRCLIAQLQDIDQSIAAWAFNYMNDQKVTAEQCREKLRKIVKLLTERKI